jgi:hypothetical protein
MFNDARRVLPLAAALAAAWLGAFAAPALAQKDDLRAAAAQLARKVKDVADKEGQTQLRVGLFNPNGIDDGNVGAGIGAELAAALEALRKGLVSPAARLEVYGTFGFFKEGTASGLKVIKITAEIKDLDSGDVKKEFLPVVFVRDNATISRLLGVTTTLPPDGTAKERNERVQDARKNPSALVHGEGGTLVSSDKDSPYDVEIRVKPLGDPGHARPRRAELVGGQAFVPIAQNEVYEVRAVNRSPHEVAVALAVDGIDQFTFSDDKKPKTGLPKFSYFIVGPGKEVIIPGWHKTADPNRKDNFLSFLVTEHGKGAASMFPTKAQGKVGLIAVSFAHSFPRGTARSAGETGFGPPVAAKQEPTERVVDPAHDFVTIRYQR